ncbi:hypothetical protein NW762_010242 [Fusarium torreyae]|uniref:Zn(2)-C6 fungal-type domain-containing protein n=1 Tax=Fusarium torreyae TaxID=1237075 RepID=A0A9W8RVW1_9HYPO|nr:hypothetical protein NW762_010242 [Fusarium torreyae]
MEAISNESEIVKPKLKRASVPKVRTGCITCTLRILSIDTGFAAKSSRARIRHLKCDEGRPFCRRCLDDKVNCDGYAPPKPKMPRKRRQAKQKPVQLVSVPAKMPPIIHEMPLLTDTEIHYFRHFIKFTTTQLSLSPSSSNFWLRYALPMAQVSDPIRYSMIAVGASHRLFMARSVGYSQQWELKRLAIHQYNKAISSILPIMADEITPSTHNTILVCCLLFISFEGLTGRYDELFRHFRAGNQLLHNTSCRTATPEENKVAGKIVEMFSQLGSGSSSFMDEDDCLSGVSRWYRENAASPVVSDLPFDDLDQVSHELRHLAVRQHNKDMTIEQEIDEEYDPFLQHDFRQWSIRFEAFVKHKGTQLSTEATAQLGNLRLRQQWWQVGTDILASEGEAPPNPEIFTSFMDTVERVAAPFIARNQPTFSLDGDLVSSLFFLANVVQNENLKARALQILHNLDRREGIWDSNDVVEVTELISKAKIVEEEAGEERDVGWELAAPAGLPGIIHRFKLMNMHDTEDFS